MATMIGWHEAVKKDRDRVGMDHDLATAVIHDLLSGLDVAAENAGYHQGA